MLFLDLDSKFQVIISQFIFHPSLLILSQHTCRNLDIEPNFHHKTSSSFKLFCPYILFFSLGSASQGNVTIDAIIAKGEETHPGYYLVLVSFPWFFPMGISSWPMFCWGFFLTVVTWHHSLVDPYFSFQVCYGAGSKSQGIHWLGKESRDSILKTMLTFIFVKRCEPTRAYSDSCIKA